MSVEEHSFCRAYLKEVMTEVRKHVNQAIIKNAWGYKYEGERNIEFHINKCEELPNGYFWCGSGCCVWQAKANGWSHFLKEFEDEE